MALIRFGPLGWSGLKAGMVIYSVENPWGHAMLIEPRDDSLAPDYLHTPPRVSVLHTAPPLQPGHPKELTSADYLGIYDGETRSQDDVLKDVCAAMLTVNALATASPELGLQKKPGCYSVAPSGILNALSATREPRTISCVGLIEDCYREADIQLVDETSIPPLTFSEMRNYAERRDPRLSQVSNAGLSRILGVPEGATTIRPLFTSYQMKAFEDRAYPYKIQSGDATDVETWQ